MKKHLFKSIIGSAFLGVYLTCLSGMQLSAASQNDRPNVLFIAIDDLRPQLNCYGYSQMITPNFDRIAEQGVVFTNHHVQMAVCIPSRVSMMTSVRPNTTRQMFGTLTYRKTTPGVKTMAEHFRENGYYTAYRGKIIHGEYPEGRVRFGLDEEAIAPDWTNSYAEPENQRLWDYGPKKQRPLVESSDKPDEQFLDGIIMERALVTMENCAKADKPFFLAVGLHKPHTPYSSPERFWDMYERDNIDLATNNYFPENMPKEAFNGWGDTRNFRETPDAQAMHLAVKNGTSFPQMSDDTARLLKHAYYACVSWTDYNIGRLLDKLKALGVAENTIIVLWGDHGYHLGDHQMWSKSTNFDVATRSPLIVSVPGMKHKNIHQDELVETVDVFPTLTELCNLPLPELTEGCSFKPLLEHPARDWKKAVFSMFSRGNEPKRTIGFSMRTKELRYTEWVSGWTESRPTDRSDYKVVSRELYLYADDPFEDRNVVGYPAHKALINQLSDRLYAGYREAGPQGWKPKSFPKGWKSKIWDPGWKNTGFEDGSTKGWSALPGPIVISTSFVDYHTGGHSMLISNRKAKEHTVAQEVRLSTGTDYKFIAWVKCLKGKSKAQLNLKLSTGDESVVEIIARANVSDSKWTKLEGVLQLKDNFENAEKSVYVTLDQPCDFYIDDFSISEEISPDEKDRYLQLQEGKLPPVLTANKVREFAGKGHWLPYKKNPVLACGAEGEFDHSALGTPSVLKVGDLYHIYYETWEKDAPPDDDSHDGPKQFRFGGEISYARARGDYTTLHIGHAISRDGINWVKDPGSPVLPRGPEGAWDSVGTWDPFVIHEDGIFKMWYGAGVKGTCDWAYAESTDGTHFEKKGRISDLGKVEDCHVVHDPASGKYRMYYWNRYHEPMGLFVAESDDEMNFDFEGARNIQIEGEIYPGRYKFTHVIREDGRWYMFYANFTRPHSWDAVTRLAVSDDGINWKTVNRNLLMGHDAEVVKVEDGLYLMYYGPQSYFDAQDCDIRVAVFEGNLTDLVKE